MYRTRFARCAELLGAVALLGASPGLARAADPVRPAASLQRSTLPRLQLTPLVLGQSATPPKTDLDFDLLGENPKPPERSAADLELDHEERVRRGMLTVHQALGLATLAMLVGTVIVGQLEYQDHFQPGAPDTAKWEISHEVLATATLVGFAGTGALALFAPVPYPRQPRIDTTFVHRLAMAGAAVGMMTELGLGLYTAGHEGFTNQASLATAHNIIGYSTMGLMSIGAAAFIF